MAHDWQYSTENIDDHRLHDGDAAVVVVVVLMMAYGNGDGGSSDGNGQPMMAHLCGSRNSSSGKSNSRQKAVIVCVLEDRVRSVLFSLHSCRDVVLHLFSSLSSLDNLACDGFVAVCRGAIHYNKGSIPLGHFLPFDRVPWVFAANGVSGDMHDSMIKRSVESLFYTQGTLKPYCLYQGSPDEEMYKWLVKRGVTVLLHEPEWIDDLWEAAKKHSSQNNKLSHLYDKKLSIQSTFARIDMPLFKELSQYSYVLYTDNDIYFRGPIQLEDLAHKMPTSLAMSYEMADMFPYNAGEDVTGLLHCGSAGMGFIQYGTSARQLSHALLIPALCLAFH